MLTLTMIRRSELQFGKKGLEEEEEARGQRRFEQWITNRVLNFKIEDQELKKLIFKKIRTELSVLMAFDVQLGKREKRIFLTLNTKRAFIFVSMRLSIRVRVLKLTFLNFLSSLTNTLKH